MAKLVRLQLSGIRSFGPNEDDIAQIKFSTPLTLLLGQNGCGKTTVIEALKFACSGDLPGKGSFVQDPKMNNSASTKAQVKLKVLDAKGNELIVLKSLQVTQKHDGALKFARVDNTLKKRTSDGKETSLSGKCGDVDTDVAMAIGVSKSILNNVIFCHQEDALWPLDEASKVKKKFDEIFDATKYNKCIETIRKSVKEHNDKIKIIKVEVGALEDKKCHADKLKNQLNEKEEQLGQIETGIAAKEKNLEPIDQRLHEISKLEDQLMILQKQHSSKEAECKSLTDLQNNLLKNIVEEYSGSDEELNREIANFEVTRNSNESKIRELQRNKIELEKKERDLNVNINRGQVKVGELQEEKRQYQSIIKERNDVLQQCCNNFSEQSAFEKDSDVIQSIRKCQVALEKQHNSLNLLVEECGKEDAQFQKEIDKCREKLTKTNQNKEIKTQETEKCKKAARDYSSQLLELNVSDKQLVQLDAKITKLENELQTAKNLFDEEATNHIITRKKQRIRQIEEELENAEDEYRILKNNYLIEADIENKVQDIDKKDAEIQKLKNKHFDNFNNIFDEIPESNLKMAVDACSMINKNKVTEINKKITSKQKEETQIETKIKLDREKLKSCEEELQKIKKEVQDVCHGKLFETVLSEVNKNVEKLQKAKGQLSSAKIMYEKFIEEFQTEKPCCPICQRDINGTGTRRVEDIINSLQLKIKDIPLELKNAEAELRDKQGQYNKLLQLQPHNEKIKTLSNETIVSLKNNIHCSEDKLKDLRLDISNLTEELSFPELKVQLCNDVIADVILIDQHRKENSMTQGSIEELKMQLATVASNATRQETENKIEDLKSEISTIRKECESAQSKLENYKSRCNNLREEKAKLVEKQLQIQKAIQSKPHIQEQIKELNTKEEALRLEIDELMLQLPILEQSLNEVETHKKESKAINQVKIEMARNNYNSNKNLFQEIKKLQEKIETYIVKDIDRLFANAIDELSKLKEQLQTLNDTKKEIADKVAELNMSLANLKESFRTLNDNLTLRQKRKQEDKIRKEILELNRQIGDHNYSTIRKEKNRLIDEREKTRDEINKCNGRKSELTTAIEDLRKELDKPDMKQAITRYKKKYFELKIAEKTVLDLQLYFQALEFSVIQFHKERMVQINKSIRELWRTIYKGNDIDYIEVKTEPLKKSSTTKRMYNYNVVQMRNGVELDMRGRCSAGQKVLACLIIRMALAETFSQNCGILALDEPTTNLDRENIISLSEALAKVVNSRQAEKNFQLLIITHDEEFLRHLMQVEKLTHYWKVQRNNKGNSEIKKETLY